MSIRKWYRHALDFAKMPISLSVIGKYGAKGYGILMLLLEEVISQIKEDVEPGKATLLLSQWADKFGLKQKGVISFFDHLKNEAHLTYELNGNVVEVEITNLSNLVDLTWDSYGRSTKKSLKRKETKQDETILNEEKNEIETTESTQPQFSFNLDRIREILSSKQEDIKERIESYFDQYTREFGSSDEFLNEYVKMIEVRYSKHGRSVEFGKDMILAAKSGRKSGLKSYETKQRIQKEQRTRDLLRTSPHRTDEVQSEIFERLKGGDDVTLEEVNQLIAAIINHLGGDEATVRSQLPILFRTKSKIESSLALSSKGSTSGTKSTKKVIDDEDDDLPNYSGKH